MKNYCKKDIEGKLRKMFSKKRVKIRKRNLIKKWKKIEYNNII